MFVLNESLQHLELPMFIIHKDLINSEKQLVVGNYGKSKENKMREKQGIRKMISSPLKNSKE